MAMAGSTDSRAAGGAFGFTCGRTSSGECCRLVLTALSARSRLALIELRRCCLALEGCISTSSVVTDQGKHP